MVYFVVLTTHSHLIAAQMEIHVAKEIVVLLVEQHVAMELVAILEYVAMEIVVLPISQYVAMELVANLEYVAMELVALPLFQNVSMELVAINSAVKLVVAMANIVIIMGVLISRIKIAIHSGSFKNAQWTIYHHFFAQIKNKGQTDGFLLTQHLRIAMQFMHIKGKQITTPAINANLIFGKQGIGTIVWLTFGYNDHDSKSILKISCIAMQRGPKVFIYGDCRKDGFGNNEFLIYFFGCPALVFVSFWYQFFKYQINFLKYFQTIIIGIYIFASKCSHPASIQILRC
jgi:hypothetical protein